MATASFVELASGLLEAMGQRLDAARPVPEGMTIRTGDGFLYAFLEDPAQVSLDTIRRLFGDGDEIPTHLVVLTPGHLPLAISAEVLRRGGTVVEGGRFLELARQLGLEAYLGQEPRAVPARPRRLLPSAQQLDQVMGRARTWLDWGVPALALRFYRQATTMKPEYVPAKIGMGRALLGLGLVEDGERVFREVLANRPDDVDARLGLAAAYGARARPKDEIEVYRALLAEDQARLEVRAHLVAALVDLDDWAGARVEIEALLDRTPEDAQLRFLLGAAKTKLGLEKQGEKERAEARTLGLPFDREVILCQHLGLPPPTPREEPTPTGPNPPKNRRARAPPAPRVPVGRSPKRRPVHGRSKPPQRAAARKRK
ncbi:MAG: tetratricopeptide repeat protein [Thermoplasmata archaeon]